MPRYTLTLFLTILTVFTFSLMPQVQAKDSKDIKYDAALSGYDYPFAVKNYTFKSQGHDLQMAYMYLPAKDASKGIVTLLHGKNFNAASWAQTATYLQKMGYGVVMPDQLGFGKSSKPKDYQYSFAAFATHTKNLLHSLGIEKSIIVGHSMGGMLASRFALLYPSVTSKLILVNPIGLENYLQYAQYKDIDFFYGNEQKKTPEKIIAYQKKNYYDGAWNDTYEALTTPLVGWIQGPDWDDLAYVSALTYDMIFTQPVIEEFKDFKVPASLIIGTRDRTGPGRGWMKPDVTYELGRYDLMKDRIQKRNSKIDVIELDGLGHSPQVENFDRFKIAFKKALSQ